MRILACFEGRVRPDSTGFYLVSALRSLGHHVDHIYPEKIHTITGGYDLYLNIDSGIYFPWNNNLHPSHYFAIDTHIIDFRLKLVEESAFDTMSVTHSAGLNYPWKCKNISWIPVGADNDIHYVGLKEKLYDGCFIGNFHNNLAGPRVEMLDVFFKAAPNFFFGSRTYRDMTEKFAQSKLVFNRSIAAEGVNMRVFEAMCSGSCLITDRVPDLDKLGFIDKGHYFGYSSKEELDELTRMLLHEDSLREKVAKNGRQFILVKHTYIHRMKDLLSKIKLNEQEKMPC